MWCRWLYGNNRTNMRGILRRVCLGVQNAKYMKRNSIGGKVPGKWICVFIEINRIFNGVFNC